MEKVIQQHTLNYASNKLELSAVKEVLNFDDRQVSLILAEGGLKITGQNLAVSQLDTNSGKLTILGTIGAISYNNMSGKTPLLKRLFK